MTNLNFAEDVLKRHYHQVRANAFARLQEVASHRRDAIVAEVTPHPEGLAMLCDTERRRWMTSVQAYCTRFVAMSFVTATVALLAIASFISIEDATVANMTAIALFTIACWTLSLCPATLCKLRSELRRRIGCVSLDVVGNHGRSIWLVGSQGLYIAVNKAPGGLGEQIEFLPFDEIGKVTVSRFDDETIVNLWSKNGRLVRVMIFPGNATEVVEQRLGPLSPWMSDQWRLWPVACAMSQSR